MSLQFIIPTPAQKNNIKTLSKGFGLPLVQRAVIAAKVALEPSDTADTSIFGTPMYDTLFITRPEYDTFEFNDYTNKYVSTPNVLASNVDYGGDIGQGLFIDGVIIDLTQKNSIIETEVVDFKAPINEYIGGGGHLITIRGFVATKHPNLYPATDVRILNSYAKAPVPLKITSVFLNDILGINEIVVKESNLFQQQGLRNVQYFQWSCVSDFSYMIKKAEPNV